MADQPRISKRIRLNAPTLSFTLSPNIFFIVADCLRVVDPALLFIMGWESYIYLVVPTHGDVWENYKIYVILGAVFLPLLFSNGPYRPTLLRKPMDTVSVVLIACAALFGSLLTFGFMVKLLSPVSRAWACAWVLSSTVTFLLLRLSTFAVLRTLQRRGVIVERVAIVGAGPLADRIATRIQYESTSRIELLGIFDDRASRLPADVTQPTGSLDQLVELGKAHSLDRLLITLPGHADRRLLQVLHKLKALSVDVMLCPDFLGGTLPHGAIEDVDGLPMLRLAHRPLRNTSVVLKHFGDFFLALLLLSLLSPVMLAIALAIKLESRGPILFKQIRHGFNNREIEVYKFRTMRHEARDPLAARQTARNDARVTRLGSILRRSSLDELPQLLNVLKGEMSLVGPRPHAVGMRTADQLSHEIVSEYAHRHRVKPGITGWAQINGYRGAMATKQDLQRRVEHDLYYIDNWSPVLDFKILILTLLRGFIDKNAF